MTQPDAYLDARVLTASPQQLHLMVVNGALRHCVAAEDAINRGDREAKAVALEEAQKHVAELIGGLSDGDDDFLDNLRALFAYAMRQLLLADARDDATAVTNAALVLERHRDTWAEVIEAAATAS